MSINGFDLAVFPAFAGVLFIIAVTGHPSSYSLVSVDLALLVLRAF